MTAEHVVEPTVPAGFGVVYVLTQGSDLVIVDAGADPAFTVTEAGEYRIHTLVFDPSTLDLSIVQFGITTGGSINALLDNPAYNICGDLDVPGAFFDVEDCPCPADAGNLSPAHDGECLAGSLDLIANVSNPPVVPEGFTVIYVLTTGSDLIIVDAGPDPNFTITEAGSYRIHTLVYDLNTLDLSIVVLGETTGFDVNGLLIQGGGDICASLDVAGAFFLIDECPCDANAGSLTPTSDNCLAGGAADLSATFSSTPNIPGGFEVNLCIDFWNGSGDSERK